MKYTKEELVNFFESQFDSSKEPYVEDVTLGYNVEELLGFKEKKKMLSTELAKLNIKPQDDKSIHAIENKIQKLEEISLKVKETQDMVISKIEKGLPAPETAIITFKTSIDAQMILNKLHRGYFQRFFDRLLKTIIVNFFIFLFQRIIDKFFKVDNSKLFKGKILKIVRAPEPSDIIWQNLHYGETYLKSKRNRIITLTIILTLVSFGLSYSLEIIGIVDNLFPESGTFVSTFIITIINQILAISITYLAPQQKNKSTTSYVSELFFMIFFSQIINTVFTNFLYNLAQHKSYYAEFFIFVHNAIQIPVLLYIDPAYRFTIYKRNKYEKKGIVDDKTQYELNKFYEEPEFNLVNKYVSIMQTLFITALYGPAVPYGILIAIFQLSMIYIIDRKIMRERSSMGSKLGSELHLFVMDTFAWFYFAFAIGVWAYEDFGWGFGYQAIIIGYWFARLPYARWFKMVWRIFNKKSIDKNIRKKIYKEYSANIEFCGYSSELNSFINEGEQ